MSKARIRVLVVVVAILLFGMSQDLPAQFRGARDPGVRGGTATGGPIPGLSATEAEMFTVGLEDFAEEETVADGVGPRFNFVSCAGCHAQPAIGGSSPADNPLFRVVDATDLNFGARNVIPSFITRRGPVREARYQFNPDGSRDGGVHALFVIAGHPQAPNCNIQQEDFERQVRNNNIVFRIPTPVFGAGLIEHLSDDALQDNLNASSFTKRNLGISGRLNRSGNDGTITRFGWKGQNKSLLIFSGEAYNVEQGFSNELFPDERGEGGIQDSVACRSGAASPNDHTHFDQTQPAAIPSDAVSFANFMRFLAPPAPVTSYGSVTAASINNGLAKFIAVGCSQCHMPSMQTGNDSSPALANKTANLFSDLLVHNMGVLGDGISQGNAGPTEFRTAPLWGLGQRI